MRYKPVPILNVVADTPAPDHGETTDNPSPTPNASNTRVNAQETMAPAATAAQDTPATDGSSVPAAGWTTTVSIMIENPHCCGEKVFVVPQQ
jgi:hypothetical protein